MLLLSDVIVYVFVVSADFVFVDGVWSGVLMLLFNVIVSFEVAFSSFGVVVLIEGVAISVDVFVYADVVRSKPADVNGLVTEVFSYSVLISDVIMLFNAVVSTCVVVTDDVSTLTEVVISSNVLVSVCLVVSINVVSLVGVLEVFIDVVKFDELV